MYTIIYFCGFILGYYLRPLIDLLINITITIFNNARLAYKKELDNNVSIIIVDTTPSVTASTENNIYTMLDNKPQFRNSKPVIKYKNNE